MADADDDGAPTPAARRRARRCDDGAEPPPGRSVFDERRPERRPARDDAYARRRLRRRVTRPGYDDGATTTSTTDEVDDEPAAPARRRPPQAPRPRRAPAPPPAPAAPPAAPAATVPHRGRRRRRPRRPSALALFTSSARLGGDDRGRRRSSPAPPSSSSSAVRTGRVPAGRRLLGLVAVRPAAARRLLARARRRYPARAGAGRRRARCSGTSSGPAATARSPNVGRHPARRRLDRRCSARSPRCMLPRPDDGVGVLLGAVVADRRLRRGRRSFVGRSAGRAPLSRGQPEQDHRGPGRRHGRCALVVAVVVVGVVGHRPVRRARRRRSCSASLVAIAAPLGDLCESLVKRDLGVKDMGSDPPGPRRRARPLRRPAVRAARRVLPRRLIDFFLT